MKLLVKELRKLLLSGLKREVCLGLRHAEVCGSCQEAAYIPSRCEACSLRAGCVREASGCGSRNGGRGGGGDGCDGGRGGAGGGARGDGLRRGLHSRDRFSKF